MIGEKLLSQEFNHWRPPVCRSSQNRSNEPKEAIRLHNTKQATHAMSY